jgi:hypothetical protein
VGQFLPVGERVVDDSALLGGEPVLRVQDDVARAARDLRDLLPTWSRTCENSLSGSWNSLVRGFCSDTIAPATPPSTRAQAMITAKGRRAPRLPSR